MSPQGLMVWTLSLWRREGAVRPDFLVRSVFTLVYWRRCRPFSGPVLGNVMHVGLPTLHRRAVRCWLAPRMMDHCCTGKGHNEDIGRMLSFYLRRLGAPNIPLQAFSLSSWPRNNGSAISKTVFEHVHHGLRHGGPNSRAVARMRPQPYRDLANAASRLPNINPLYLHSGIPTPDSEGDEPSESTHPCLSRQPYFISRSISPWSAITHSPTAEHLASKECNIHLPVTSPTSAYSPTFAYLDHQLPYPRLMLRHMEFLSLSLARGSSSSMSSGDEENMRLIQLRVDFREVEEVLVLVVFRDGFESNGLLVRIEEATSEDCLSVEDIQGDFLLGDMVSVEFGLDFLDIFFDVKGWNEYRDDGTQKLILMVQEERTSSAISKPFLQSTQPLINRTRQRPTPRVASCQTCKSHRISPSVVQNPQLKSWRKATSSDRTAHCSLFAATLNSAQNASNASRIIVTFDRHICGLCATLQRIISKDSKLYCRNVLYPGNAYHALIDQAAWFAADRHEQRGRLIAGSEFLCLTDELSNVLRAIEPNTAYAVPALRHLIIRSGRLQLGNPISDSCADKPLNSRLLKMSSDGAIPVQLLQHVSTLIHLDHPSDLREALDNPCVRNSIRQAQRQAISKVFAMRVLIGNMRVFANGTTALFSGSNDWPGCRVSSRNSLLFQV
ncbi:uncharacterized protein MYCFIDRAFT_177983 [Pseudocercospora fijiensis CIRAD86]|uniref:Uncharacterized protein n=1 Tax=Pseudocercospora fijiensis (strain CIRAD86) TaxID=383855 RepID=M3A434_PSEFD|nr:uncharacterized protein MYCFIDRAFT_177983 [Pseudocercospora fijiensis CIRAD86]EME79381.1 hypothetical protein MYCFIDRAFT_177983 [Pseudocercospora fijiensis CIRAD86]